MTQRPQKPAIYDLFEDNPKSERISDAVTRHTLEGKKILTPSELLEHLDTLIDGTNNIHEPSDRAVMVARMEAVRDRLNWGKTAIAQGDPLEAFAAGFEVAASMFSISAERTIEPELHRNKASHYQQSGEYEHRQKYENLKPRDDWIVNEWKAFVGRRPKGSLAVFRKTLEEQFDRSGFEGALPGERQIRNILKKRGFLKR